MTNAQTDADWRADQDRERRLLLADDALAPVEQDFARFRLGAEVKALREKLAEERARIVQVWD